MKFSETERYRILSFLFTYPTREFKENLNYINPSSFDGEAKFYFEKFLSFLKGTPLSELEELYTASFDLQPPCPPYIGYHLYGDDYRRAGFLVLLKEMYASYNYHVNNGELPDHLSTVVGFLGYLQGEDREIFIKSYFLPSLNKMKNLLREENPYSNYFNLLLKVLQNYRAEGKNE